MPLNQDDEMAVTTAAINDVPYDDALDDYIFDGNIDFFGYHATAGGWLFGGWITHPWPLGNRPQNVVAHFAKEIVATPALLVFWFRADVESRGIGYLFFLPSPSQAGEKFLDLEIEFSKRSYRLQSNENVPLFSEQQLTLQVQPILAAGEEDSTRRKLLELIVHGERVEAVSGFIDFYGYHSGAGGWMFAGWVSSGWSSAHRPERLVASFEGGDVAGEAIAAIYPRPDLKGAAKGATLFLRSGAKPVGSLISISFDLNGVRSTMHVGVSLQRVREQELLPRSRPLLTLGSPDAGCDSMLAILARRPYAGEDTLAGLSDPVLFEVDEAIVCEPDGLLLMGWHLAKPGVVRDIRIRCGARAVPFDLCNAIVVDRPDVVAAFVVEHGFDDARCGFIAFIPHSVVPEERAYVEIETCRGEIGFHGLPRPKLQGIAAIRHILERVNVRFRAVPHAYDRVIGPAVELLNRGRLAKRPLTEVITYGRAPVDPRFSVIIPLYGRLDFVEYQMALFSEHSPNVSVDFIYVLDDPSLRREAQSFCISIYERFRIPFKLLLLERNVGFAPASNIGLAHATGQYAAFLNSDVIPGTLDWLERLSAQLEAHPELGVIGALLLFEDGSVQHQGMEFRRQREFGDWLFCHHQGKGLRYSEGRGLRRCVGVTGACMVMERSLAGRVGGFDEVYVIGDFEDSDLCLRLRALGFGCAVDPEVQLYHLERKSQVSSAAMWRQNLTIYNAWQHQRRWAAAIIACEEKCADPKLVQSDN
jgi:GT2 family glycosyltransferase